MATKWGVTVGNSVKTIKLTDWKWLYSLKCCHYQQHINYTCIIHFPCYRKHEVLVHFNKTHVKKCRFFFRHLRLQELRIIIYIYIVHRNYHTTIHWNRKAVSVTALVFTEDAEDKLEHFHWIPGFSRWRPYPFYFEQLLCKITFLEIIMIKKHN